MRLKSILVSISLSWELAAKYCHQKLGGTLLAVRGKTHQRLLADYISRIEGQQFHCCLRLLIR